MNRKDVLLLAALFSLGGVGFGVFGAQAFMGGAQHNGLPLVLPYQGTLQKDGQAADGQETMQFRLFGANDQLLWTSDVRTVQLQQGRFSVVLGDSHDTSEALEPSDLAQGELYVEVCVGGACSGSNALSPRQRIAPTPQAVHSAQAASAQPGSALRVELDDTAGRVVPTGSIAPFAGSLQEVPTGWLPCDGTARRSADYPELDRVLSSASWGNDFSQCKDASGNAASGCDLQLPDLRGYFLRGVDPRTLNKQDPDAPRTVGDVQLDEFEEHRHNHKPGAGTARVNRGVDIFLFDQLAGTQETDPAGGPETRPLNRAVLYIIKH